MRQFLIVCAAVVLIRLPFLNQAIQGDDYYYLAAAQHAQIDPLHPHHARYVFLGDLIDMRGHPHPPGNAWVLAGLLAALGDIGEIPFHAAYLLFSLLAAWAVWRLAQRLVPDRAPEAALLFVFVPAFVVNGTSLEADLPFLAFWLCAIALFVERRLALAALALAIAALMAYQSVVLVPTLALYLWWHRRSDRASWLVLLTPLAVLGAYQAFERITSGSVPAEVLAGHFSTYRLQTAAMKWRNAVALTGHFVVMFSPLGFAGLLAAFRRSTERWLMSWVALFYLAALVLFFAGSARYLLPLAAPAAILLAIEWRERPVLLRFSIVLQVVVALGLAWVNQQHWDGYRTFASRVADATQGKRVWVDGEWGLRFYCESNGALALRRGQMIQPGDYLVSSELSGGVPFTAGGGALTAVEDMAILPSLPLRLVGRGSGSGYSSVSYGLWPFGISREPIDRLALKVVTARAPALAWLPMSAPEAEFQIVSGLYGLEQSSWRWAARRGAFLLKNPGGEVRIAAEFHIPDASPARVFRLAVDGVDAAEFTAPGPGRHTIQSPPRAFACSSCPVTLTADRDFSPAGDNRTLSYILTAVGFRN